MADASLKNPRRIVRLEPGLDKARRRGRRKTRLATGRRPGLRRGRLRVRTLVTQRWLDHRWASQTVAVLVAGLVLGFRLPYALCFAVIAVSAWLNVLTGLALGRPADVRRAARPRLQLAFDILQIWPSCCT